MKLPVVSPWAQWALWPLGAAFGGVTRLRAWAYRGGLFQTRRLDGTVISVGNLTVGGTGKTPMVLWIAEKLAAEGARPAILTRGYRGTSAADGNGAAASDSDEVALLQMRLGERAQFGVGKNRYENGEALARGGARWFILDDGFQHLGLARDADIVLLDSADPFGGGQTLPAGRMREPRAALERAEVVVITRTRSAPALEAEVRRWTEAPVFYAWAELETVLRAPQMGASVPAGEAAGTKVFAFCGIGNPEAFFGDLRRWKFSLAGERKFPDHHRYTRADIEAIEAAARSAGAGALVCTEKDVFNLRGAPRPELPVWACRIRMEISDAAGFWNAVLAAIERSEAGRAAGNREASPA